jgi:hypothetical protein
VLGLAGGEGTHLGAACPPNLSGVKSYCVVVIGDDDERSNFGGVATSPIGRKASPSADPGGSGSSRFVMQPSPSIVISYTLGGLGKHAYKILLAGVEGEDRACFGYSGSMISDREVDDHALFYFKAEKIGTGFWKFIFQDVGEHYGKEFRSGWLYPGSKLHASK